MRARQTGPYVTLAARGRKATYNRSPIVAEVSLGYSERSCFDGTRYQHPEVRLGTAGEDGRLSSYGMRATITLQTHILRSDEKYDRPGYRGFVAPSEGRTVPCYAPKIEHDLEYPAQAKSLAKAADLVMRARDAAPDGIRCDLLKLIVGLRNIGVAVRVYSKRVETLRSCRPC